MVLTRTMGWKTFQKNLQGKQLLRHHHRLQPLGPQQPQLEEAEQLEGGNPTV
jgi:hypothetical protein